MPPTRLMSLLIRWQEAFENGVDLPAGDLCPGDPALAQRLRPLLENLRQIHRMDNGVADKTEELPTMPPPVESSATQDGKALSTDAEEEPTPDGVRIPGYEILGELGRGGTGVVYKARQVGLGRLVALKMILAGGHAGEADLTRFTSEAKAIARLQHPNIVAVYEVGQHEGKPFFSLEFCDGGSLDRQLAGNPLPADKAAALVQTLARVMQAAHASNVIHRDLKPANVLLSFSRDAESSERSAMRLYEGALRSEDSASRLNELTPKITDFGLAKRLDEAGQTNTGAIVGTPSYMAPEQAEGKKDVGPAADIYALGAILYECLTGRPPFRAATAFDTIMQVVSEEPVPPRRLNAKVPLDLETVTLKCLEKEPVRRYASAGALADDLGRYLAGESVQALPVGLMDRVWRWERHNPVVAGLAAVIVMMMLAGIAATTSYVLQARKNERRANEAAKKAREETQRADRKAMVAKEATSRAETGRHGFQMTAAWRAWQQNDVAAAEAYLDEVPLAFQQTWECRHVRQLCRRKAMTLMGHTHAVTSVAISPDGKRIVSGSEDNTVKVWDAGTGKLLLTLEEHTKGVLCVAISPDGKRIVSGSEDHTLKVWDAGTGQDLLTLKGHTHQVTTKGHTGKVTSVAISPNGKRFPFTG